MSNAALSLYARIRTRAFAPVDLAPLVWFRIVFGGLMLVEIVRFFANGWITRYFVEPVFLFKFYGFAWVQPLAEPGLKFHFLLLGLLAVCIMVGVLYRLATILFFLGFTYVFLLEQARYLNHFYLICLFSFLLIFVPAHRAFSVDAWLRPPLRRSTAPAWALWLLRAQLCVVFFFAGVAKLNGDWLQGEPMRMWLAKRAAFPVIGPLLTQGWTPWFFSYAGLLFDLLIVPFLLRRRTRWWAFAAAAGFNLTNAWIFNIGIFPWLTLGATIILFAPKLPRPIRSLWTATAAEPTERPWQRPAILAFVGTYSAVQVLVPLRHWLYPSPVHWTEEGHRFSWRMKLRDKQAKLALYAHNPDSNQTWRVALPNYISRSQYDEASGRPDMILQLCHYVAEDFRKIGHPKIQIRARVLTSLNGRAEQLLLDPDVDLAAEPRNLGHATWITTLTTPLGVKRPSRRAAEPESPPEQ